jgi:hypothetical protein
VQDIVATHRALHEVFFNRLEPVAVQRVIHVCGNIEIAHVTFSRVIDVHHRYTDKSVAI